MTTALEMWERLSRRYRELKIEMKEVRAGLDKAGRSLGVKYPPQAVLRCCPSCNGGPFSARDLRAHRCLKTNKRAVKGKAG